MKHELMPDPEAELKRMVEELRAISAVLDATETPALVRPDVPYKQVTEELVHWAVRVYAYSILSQFREMLRSALNLYDADHVPAVFLCARAMWEMAAHSYYVKKHCFQYMDKKDWQATWDFMLGIKKSRGRPQQWERQAQQLLLLRSFLKGHTSLRSWRASMNILARVQQRRPRITVS
jgi:hypothetical protein